MDNLNYAKKENRTTRGEKCLERYWFPQIFLITQKKPFYASPRSPGYTKSSSSMLSMPRHTKHGWTHQVHIENARIQLEEDKKFLDQLGFVVKVSVDVITSGDISTAILRKAECEKVS